LLVPNIFTAIVTKHDQAIPDNEKSNNLWNGNPPFLSSNSDQEMKQQFLII